ncbi:unnamed protein product [Musa banksii]
MSLTIMCMKSLLLRDSVKVIVNKGGMCVYLSTSTRTSQAEDWCLPEAPQMSLLYEGQLAHQSRYYEESAVGFPSAHHAVNCQVAVDDDSSSPRT